MDLILDLPISAPHLPGYIYPRIPHGVNHLILGDLGNEEIVVLACDDGDVIAYTTRSITNYLAMKGGRDLETTKNRLLSDQIRPLFHRNVGISAWGLAIHTVARMIAVSTNNHEIKVFAFALAQRKSDSDCCEEDSNIPISSDKRPRTLNHPDNDKSNKEDCTVPLDRSQDIEITLRGCLSNIPNISFANIANDQDGRYLSSIDITGDITVWNVWKKRVVIRHFGPDHHYHHSSVP